MINATFPELVRRFLEVGKYERSYSPATVSWYEQRLRAFRQRSGIERLEDVTKERVRSFLADGRRERGWSSDYTLGFHKTLRVFLKWCIEEGYLRESPMIGVPRPKLDKKLPKRLSRQDAAALLDAVARVGWATPFERTRNVALIGVMLLAGLRAAELLRLRLGDLDLEERVITVRHGKWGKDRLVPFEERLQQMMRLYLVERERLKPREDLLFFGCHQRGPLRYRSLRLIISRIREEKGIAFSAHRLRHTYASLMLEGGCDLFSLSKLLGHEQVTTTAIYLSVSISHLRQGVARHPLETSN